MSPAKDRGIKGDMVAIYFRRNSEKQWNQISAVFGAFYTGPDSNGVHLLEYGT
jgi:hypothetical protein